MTKKHFIALADAIREHNKYYEGATFNTFQLETLASFCSCQNRNFNRQLWLDYIDGKCGPGGGKLK